MREKEQNYVYTTLKACVYFDRILCRTLIEFSDVEL